MTTNRSTFSRILKFILIALGMEVFSLGLGVLAGVISIRVWGDGSLIDLGLAIMGFILGGIFGIVAGIIALKYLFHQHGSVIVALIVAAVWGGVVTVLALTINLGITFVSNLISILFLLLPAVAVGGFYLKRDRKPAETANS
jgi:hypothetical protein